MNSVMTQNLRPSKLENAVGVGTRNAHETLREKSNMVKQTSLPFYKSSIDH